MTVVGVKINDELYALLAKESDRTGKPMNQILVERLARSYGKPELGIVPRKKMGRPRKPRPEPQPA